MSNILFIFLVLLSLRQGGSILPVERRIAASPLECAAGWDRDGKLAFERCGDSAGEFVVTQSEGAAVWNGTFTHSHPDLGPCWSFSEADMYWSADAWVKEMRAVSIRDGILRVAIARGTTVFRAIDRQIVADELSKEQRLHPDNCEFLDATWRALALRYAFAYEVVQEELAPQL